MGPQDPSTVGNSCITDRIGGVLTGLVSGCSRIGGRCIGYCQRLGVYRYRATAVARYCQSQGHYIAPVGCYRSIDRVDGGLCACIYRTRSVLGPQ